MQSKKRACVLLLPVLLLVLFANAFFPFSSGEVEKVLVMAQTSEPRTLNMALTVTFYDELVAGQIFQGLVGHDWQMAPKPELAESWEISADGLTITFHLVRNVKWHDGQLFTSADVKFSFEQVLLPYHPAGKSNFAVISSIETPDPITVVFKLKNPFPALFKFLTAMYAAIVPKHLYEGTDILKNAFNGAPIGTGPFKFKEWIKGDHITLVKNENYFKENKPYLDMVVVRIIPDMSALMMAFEKGEVNYVPYYFPYYEVDRFKKMEGFNVTLQFSPWCITDELGFNLNNPILKNVEVRRAILYAIDRKDILTKVGFDNGILATGPIANTPFTAWAYNPNVVKYDRDLEKANNLLDQAGYPKGADGIRFKINVYVIAARYDHIEEAELIRDQLKEVGVSLEIVAVDYAVWDQNVFKTWNFDIAIVAMTAGGPDPHYEFQHYHSTRHIPVSWSNFIGYNNSRVDQLFELGMIEINKTKRAQYYYEIQDIMAKELPAAWIFVRYSVSAYNTKFEGLPPGVWMSEGMEDVNYTEAVAPAAFPTEWAIVAVVIIAVVAASIILIYRRRKH